MNKFTLLAGCLLAGALASPAAAQQPENIVLQAGQTKQLSPHVWAIFGNPNIGIVVGSTATLVVDTGLGNRNGAFIAAEAARLRPGNKLLLTTTHAHAEHASGQDGFPATTVVMRPKVQQQEFDETGGASIDTFRSRNDTNRNLLIDARVAKADVLFDDTLTVDLGGVTARIVWFGPAHSNGDTLVFAEPDGVLISGDVVQNKVAFSPNGSQSSFKSWFAVLDKISALKPTLILPDHSPPGGFEMIAEQRGFMADVLQRSQALKREGKSVEEASRLIADEVAKRYPGWGRMMFVPRAVAVAYNEG